jgi:putative hydrolase of HD superfamily
MSDARLGRILAFLEEADRLKTVERRTRVGPRQENSAEHSWHIALYVLLLAGELQESVDAGHAIELCLVHDLVEIHAGDTYAFDDAARVEQAEREREAAVKLFALLPEDLGGRLRELWEEFEAGQTPEARLAVAVDRLQALAQNLASEGAVWRENAIRVEQVRERNAETLAGDPALASLVETLLERGAPYFVQPPK